MNDLYTFDYKNYMKEACGIETIDESPVSYPGLLRQCDDDLLVNTKVAIEVEKNAKQIDDFRIGNNVRYRVFKHEENGSVYYYLLDPNQPVLSLMHQIREINKGVESLDIWCSRRNRYLARSFWIPDYIMKHYDFMISDKVHTKDGKRFWKAIMEDFLEKKLSVSVINTKTQEKTPITSVDDVETYYGKNAFHYRFIISNITSPKI